MKGAFRHKVYCITHEEVLQAIQFIRYGPVYMSVLYAVWMDVYGAVNMGVHRATEKRNWKC